MKGMKFLSVICLCALLAVCLFALPTRAEAAVVESGACGENVSYTLDDQGTLIITGTGPMNSWGWFNAPWGEDERIVKVIIEEGVTNIPPYTFNQCENLAEVSLPNTITSIGNWAFNGCTALNQIVIPDSVETIGDQAFEACDALQKVKLSNSLKTLGSDAFSDCASLKSIILPDSLEAVNRFLDNCPALESITVPHVDLVFGRVFGQFYFEGSVGASYDYEQNGYPMIVTYFLPPNLKTVTVTGGVLEERCFSNSTTIETLILGENVTKIQDNAFYGCTFNTVFIENPNVEISANAFAGITADVYCPDMYASGNYGGNLTWHSGAQTGYKVGDTARKFYSVKETLEIPEVSKVYTFDGRSFVLPTTGEATLGSYDNSAPGKKTVNVSFSGQSFPYEYVVVSAENVVLTAPKVAEFDGKEGKVVPTAACFDVPMTLGLDYLLSYKDNTFAGDNATVTATGVGVFEGWSDKCTYSVVKADLSNATVSAADQEYNGSPRTTWPSVTWNGVTLQEDRDYVLAYRDNVSVGTATVQVLGIGNYMGVATGTFEITKPASSKTIQYGTSSATVTSGVTVDMKDQVYCGYELYKNGSLVRSSNGSVSRYVSVSFSSPGTYSLEIFTQSYTLVSGSPRPYGSKYWSTYTIYVVSGPGDVEAPEKLTPKIPTQTGFRTMCLEVESTPAEADIYPLVWNSSDPAVASVAGGVLTLHKAGKTTVTATVNGLTATWDLELEPLDIQKKSKVYYNAADKTTEVIYENQLLKEGVDYTAELISGGEYDELVITGIGLFGGSITKLYTPGTDEPYCMGDLNGDLLVNTEDVVALLLYISMPDMFPIDAPADFTGDGQVTTEDAVKLLLHISMPDMFPL